MSLANTSNFFIYEIRSLKFILCKVLHNQDETSFASIYY